MALKITGSASRLELENRTLFSEERVKVRKNTKAIINSKISTCPATRSTVHDEQTRRLFFKPSVDPSMQ